MIPKDTRIVASSNINNPVYFFNCSVAGRVKTIYNTVQTTLSVWAVFGFGHIHKTYFQSTIFMLRTIIKFNSDWPILVTGRLKRFRLPQWIAGTKQRRLDVSSNYPFLAQIFLPSISIYVTSIYGIIIIFYGQNEF